MARLFRGVGAMVILSALALPVADVLQVSAQSGTKPAAPAAAATADELDRLMAPVALYPDQLLAQMLLCAANPGKLQALNEWLASQQTLKGSELQDVAVKAGFEASFVALALFPDVVQNMAQQPEWTARVGQLFAADRNAVFASIQRLRAKAQSAGKLKDSPQQDVETRTTSSGQQVIVIEPSNPQVVYVPQYNPTTVYTPGTTSTTVIVKEDDDSSDEVAAGLIGFTAGIALGAAIDNDYYYGPYGWYGGGYMYNDAWDDYYDAREDAREDWQDHREDLYEERGDRAENAQEQRSERAQNAQEQRTDRQQTRQENRPESQAQREQRRSDAKTAASEAGVTRSDAAARAESARSSAEARGYSRDGSASTAQRSGAKSDAFSNYSSGRSERAASQRGQRSRSSSRGGGGRRR
jgi:hypothetical protein